MARREVVVGGDGRPAAQLAFTDATDGDLRVPGAGSDVVPDLAARRRRVAPHPWTWLRQVHGARVVEVDTPGEWVGTEADAAVTTTPGAVLAVHTADCAGVLLIGDGSDPVSGEAVRVLGAAHAGWRGLLDGVLEATVEHMRRLGADRFRWDLGPCISPAAYAFGDSDLDRLVERLGPELRSTTLDGSPALDLRAGVRIALHRAGVDEPVVAGCHAVPCTALDAGFFSWRARRDTGRQAAVIWLAADDRDHTDGR